MKLSIIILNYNTREHLSNCLKSLQKTKETFKKEVIVVDNASSDDSVSMVKSDFPQFKMIVSPKNLNK